MRSHPMNNILKLVHKTTVSGQSTHVLIMGAWHKA